MLLVPYVYLADTEIAHAEECTNEVERYTGMCGIQKYLFVCFGREAFEFFLGKNYAKQR